MIILTCSKISNSTIPNHRPHYSLRGYSKPQYEYTALNESLHPAPSNISVPAWRWQPHSGPLGLQKPDMGHITPALENYVIFILSTSKEKMLSKLFTFNGFSEIFHHYLITFVNGQCSYSSVGVCPVGLILGWYEINHLIHQYVAINPPINRYIPCMGGIQYESEHHALISSFNLLPPVIQ